MSKLTMTRRNFLQFSSKGIGTLTLAGSLFYTRGLFADDPPPNPLNYFKLQVVFDNICKNDALSPEWGIAMWMRAGQQSVLFDTGSDGKILMKNIVTLGLKPKELTAIVISHRHWDHADGLTELLKYTNDGIPVYIPKDSKSVLSQKISGANFKEIVSPTEIIPNVWSSGSMAFTVNSATVYEQALVANTANGLVICTACAHPGLVKLVKAAQKIIPGRPVYLLAGGFHMVRYSLNKVKEISNTLKKMGVMKVAPSHCTGNEAVKLFQKRWGKRFVNLSLGDKLIIK